MISGARKLIDHSNEELVEIVMSDLKTMIPASTGSETGARAGAEGKTCDDGARAGDLSPSSYYADADPESVSRGRLGADRFACDDRKRRDFRARRCDGVLSRGTETIAAAA